jgi:hypothetical protein
MSHRTALEATLASSAILARPEHAALIELARTLAGELDGPHPTARATTAYLSVLKDVGRVIAAAPEERPLASLTAMRKSLRAVPPAG